jgi:hypothetical protein
MFFSWANAKNARNGKKKIRSGWTAMCTKKREREGKIVGERKCESQTMAVVWCGMMTECN